MSQAAKQLRENLEATFPGIRIGRKACRDTVTGGVSQHSAYGYGDYDSNALDIMGPSLSLGYTYAETQAWLDVVYAYIMEHFFAWSLRIVLWRAPGHYGHIHCDFSPTCLEHEWCGRSIFPRWAYSDGSTFTSIDPEPENGEYHGPVEPEPEPEEEDEMPSLEVFVQYLRKSDIEKMGTDRIITADETEYFVSEQMWIDDNHKRNPNHPDWENLYNAYRVRSPIWAV